MGFYATFWVTFVGLPEVRMEFQEGWRRLTGHFISWQRDPTRSSMELGWEVKKIKFKDVVGAESSMC